jgi:hypothetical protein
MPTSTNPEAIPGFDAVAESRKWREATSRKLSAMSREERLAYLNAARTRYLAGRSEDAVRDETCVVREEDGME